MNAFSPRQMFLLDLACQPLEAAFGGVYLVGTAAERKDYRDVDVRAILSDQQYDAFLSAVGLQGVSFLALAVGQYLAALTNLPIDFQFQRQTEANAKHAGIRNPLGMRSLDEFRGDAHGALAEKGADRG